MEFRFRSRLSPWIPGSPDHVDWSSLADRFRKSGLAPVVQFDQNTEVTKLDDGCVLGNGRWNAGTRRRPENFKSEQCARHNLIDASHSAVPGPGVEMPGVLVFSPSPEQ